MTASHSVPLCIAPDHPALAGHFPGRPVVPGVVLLQRVATAWKAWRGMAVGQLDAKFIQPLLPGEAATIVLREDGDHARFEVARADGQSLARGTLAPVRGRA